MRAMDWRALLVRQLSSHRAEDDKETRDLAAMRRHALELAEPLSPSQWPAHFTASAVVVDPGGERVCLVFHKKLERWLQPGGHIEPADGADFSRAALREVLEETGLDARLHERAAAPLDVDIHFIPARGAAPGHEHLDVRFLVVAATRDARHDPAESLGLRWFGWGEALEVAGDAALVRLLEKARRHAAH